MVTPGKVFPLHSLLLSPRPLKKTIVLSICPSLLYLIKSPLPILPLVYLLPPIHLPLLSPAEVRGHVAVARPASRRVFVGQRSREVVICHFPPVNPPTPVTSLSALSPPDPLPRITSSLMSLTSRRAGSLRLNGWWMNSLTPLFSSSTGTADWRPPEVLLNLFSVVTSRVCRCVLCVLTRWTGGSFWSLIVLYLIHWGTDNHLSKNEPSIIRLFQTP